MVIRLPKWLLLSICAFFLSQGNKAIGSLFEYSKNIEILTALYKELGTHYVDEIEPGTLMKTGIDAMLKSLDPYTNFFSEYQAEEALMERQGHYGGVGCSVVLRNNYPIITDIEDSYAFDKADIHLGDVITHINGIHLRNKTIEELLTLFRGAPNTAFSLVLQREGVPLKKSILRMAVKTPSVAYSGLLDHNIAYIKLEEFNENAAGEIAQSLTKMMDNIATTNAAKNTDSPAELQGVILDLRDNGGGLLNEAVKIVGLFVGENRSVVTLRGHNMGLDKNNITTNKALLPNTPLVVLVNARSASASEVVSGSLQDMDRAIILGQTSFGKGLVQNYAPLPYRTQMKLTVAKYYTPSGRCIQKLQYSDRDENGKPKQMNQSQKKAFKTANGRIVYEGGGIDPDRVIDPFQGIAILQWITQENILFDWANHAFNVNPDSSQYKPSDADFEQFVGLALGKTESLLKGKMQKALNAIHGDSVLIKQLGLMNVNTAKLNTQIKSEIDKNKNTILKMMTRELLLRKYKKPSFYRLWLHRDPETQDAVLLLSDLPRYQGYLKTP
ncbi:MAG: hypothetical protein CK532_06220 [Flavobacteriales bacterium]|nr:MAG: hypothetical protein CK532_06220 [Flavobacteriales bacterium]